MEKSLEKLFLSKVPIVGLVIWDNDGFARCFIFMSFFVLVYELS